MASPNEDSLHAPKPSDNSTYRMSKYCLLISSTRLNNIFWTFCLRRNNKCEFIEINDALL